MDRDVRAERRGQHPADQQSKGQGKRGSHGHTSLSAGTPARQKVWASHGDRIVRVGNLSGVRAKTEIDARGLAVAPGFINMLSWAPESLIHDGRGLSDTVQGVTLEVFGEGQSMGPWNAKMKSNELKRQGDIKYPIRWTTLGEYLEYMQRKGVTPNLASFVGAAVSGTSAFSADGSSSRVSSATAAFEITSFS